MATQKSFIKIKGRVGDLTFYKSQDGHLVREKGGIDARRIKSDPEDFIINRVCDPVVVRLIERN